MWLLMPVKTVIRYWFCRIWQNSYASGCVKTQPPQPSVPETWEKKWWKIFLLYTAIAYKLYVFWGLQFFGMWRRITLWLVPDLSRQHSYPIFTDGNVHSSWNFNIWKRGHWVFSKHRTPFTLWREFTSRNNGDFNYTIAETWSSHTT
jgi:hypothetical protein